MYRIALLLALVASTCGPAPLVGQDTLALSLSDAIQRGLENNYQVRIAANELEVARNNDDYALTQKYPTITLGLSPGVNYRNQSNPASIVAQSTVTSYAIAPTAQLNWVLFNGGSAGTRCGRGSGPAPAGALRFARAAPRRCNMPR